MNLRPALTLIEVMLVIAIVGVISAAAFKLTTNFRTRQALTSSAEEVVTAIRRAHVFSRESKDDQDWGVKQKSPSTFVLESRSETGTTEVYQYKLIEPIEFGQTTFELWFDQGSGDTAANAILVVKAPNGETKNIGVSQNGLAEVQ